MTKLEMIKNIFMIASVSIMFGGIEIRSCIHASQINTSATYCLLNKTLLEFTTSIEFIACIDALLTQGTSVIDMRLMLPEKVFDAIKRIPHTPLLITLDQNKGTAILKDVGGILKIYYGIVDILLPGVVSFDCDTIVINIEGAKHAINKWLWETNNITDSELLNGAVFETMNIVLE